MISALAGRHAVKDRVFFVGPGRIHHDGAGGFTIRFPCRTGSSGGSDRSVLRIRIILEPNTGLAIII
jgi:hypothetical protein